jgi:hypothetical protein
MSAFPYTKGNLCLLPKQVFHVVMGPTGVAEAVWEVLVKWGRLTWWLRSRLECDDPGRCQVRVGGGSKLEVGVLVVERNFTDFSVTVPMTTSGSVTSPVFGLGVMVRWRWMDPMPSAIHTQELNTKVSPRLRAAAGLMMMEAVEFAMRSSVRSLTWHARCQCFRLATY